MNSNLVTLPGYHLSELIHESDRTIVYRGQNKENEQPIIIKLMGREYPSFSELVQFRNQYAIAKNLDITGIVKSLALERYENRYALIMEDTGGISLAKYEERTSLSIPQFLEIAIQLSDILHQLHNHSIIHKDIKPANILIDPETQKIKLIDFSISTLLPRETQTLHPLNILEGTLAYISPEQTGRMNRGIDYRSDFYSLGVTLYELLTGTLPFQNEDPLELIHAHITESPAPVSMFICLGGKVCPQPLSDMVLKLMAKNAEERYQSALGLKYDLEKCLSQYRATGTIEPFELGKRDICDRFIIPEKLYGREAEVQMLLDAFERVSQGAGEPQGQGDTGTGGHGEGDRGDRTSSSPSSPSSSRSELLLVAGFSGIGKTAVVNEVHKPIVRQRGYFIKGKFDQFNRNIPFSAFVQAFRDLVVQLLGESDADLANWKTAILQAVGNNGQVLIKVIPELERIIGSQPPVAELDGNAAQNRFNLLLQKFIAVFTTPEHPLVIFLDDLQWADSASLKLMNILMGNGETGYLLLLGAYRDNEVYPAHPLMLTLSALENAGATMSTITLAPLTQAHINQIVAETLSCCANRAMPLTELVYQKTQGNPFFTTQFLQGLHEDHLIIFNLDLGYWECDLVQVHDAALTDDVVEFMAGRLQKLPAATQEMLKFASCIGNQFDLETLAIASSEAQEEVATHLWSALQEGLVLPISEAYKFLQGDVEQNQTQAVTIGYRFLHDRVQQAAYSLIPNDQGSRIRLNIGKLLLEKTPNLEAEENRLFDIVGYFNSGVGLIAQQSQRYDLAQLNLMAGEKAKSCTAYCSAFEYFSTGLDLLAEDCWQTKYSLTLNLYLEATEVSYLTGNFELMEQHGETVLSHAENLLDTIRVYETWLQARAVRSQFRDGIELGLHCLRLLGIYLPNNPETSDMVDWLNRVKVELAAFSTEELVKFSPMSDPVVLSAMRVLSRLIPLSYFGCPNLFPIIACQGILLSLKYGNAIDTSVSYINYALALCNPGVNDLVAGYQYGQVAKQLMESQNSDKRRACVLNNFYFHVSFWKEHARNGIPELMNGYQSGLEFGELEFSAFNLANHALLGYVVGERLDQVQKNCKVASDFARSSKFGAITKCVDCTLQAILNLVEKTEIPWCLQGTAYDETLAQEFFQSNRNFLGLFLHHLRKLNLSYLFGDLLEALNFLEEGEKYYPAVGSYLPLTEFAFLASLTYVALTESMTDRERIQYFNHADTWLDRLKLWSTHAPMNFQHKVDLVEAEKYRVLGQKLDAINLYDRAIAGAKENEYIQEEALANELFAKFYIDWGKEKYAAFHMQEAYYCYAGWGAKAKTDDLEERYPELLKPILQRNRSTFSSKVSISQITSKFHSQTPSVINISSILDFSSLLKASHTLSGEIELERLVSTLMKMIFENAEATKGALLLTGERELTIEAIATRNNNDLQFDSLHQSILLDNYLDLPSGLINYVRHTTETVLLDAETAQTQFANDNYLLRFSPQSLLCMPLQERGNLIGILYLENTLTADAFPSERIELLDALCAQAAISLTNAKLYQQVQQALQNLQEAQLQLVQNEKMATLGNLVAGVAHEINNPVGFIGGNVNVAQKHLQDLFAILSLYQKNTSPPEAILEEIEDLDLEFIAEDFQKLMTSMQKGCDRIGIISTSLRTFSRTDTATKTEFNLHEGIDSTLLILKYRLKANEHRPAIEIVKSYGNIPVVKCYAEQLNQVFMNLLANAIDALEESNKGKSYSEIEKAPNRITIATEFVPSENHVIVRITDNGMGMPEEVRAKIFEQGFTTKGVGKGTGLGMAIAHQIVVNAHGGSLEVDSEVNQGTEFCIYLPSN